MCYGGDAGVEDEELEAAKRGKAPAVDDANAPAGNASLLSSKTCTPLLPLEDWPTQLSNCAC